MGADTFPIDFYDYFTVANAFSAEVAGTGGLNVTNPHSSHTSFYNPGLLAFRQTTTLSATLRHFSEGETDYGADQLPESNSNRWFKNGFSYFGMDTENLGFSYFALTKLQMDREIRTEEVIERYYVDYYLDAYRFSFADRSGLVAFGFNMTLLAGRAVYLQETIVDQIGVSELFVDSRAWGYNLDFGAVLKSGNLAYGVMVPNLLSRVYWQDNPNYSLQRRLHAGMQFGDDYNYILTGISRKFDLSSDSVYHIGLQQILSFGVIRGDYHYLPLRVGIHAEEFRRLRDIGYSAGTGYRYSIFQIDISYMMSERENNGYGVLMAISVGL